MAHKGLTKDLILQEAYLQVEERGFEHFSLRELAVRLGVRPASLYNHISGVEEITAAVADLASERLCTVLREATVGREPDDAFRSGAWAYRRFADEHPEIYQALIHMPSSDDERLVRASFASYAPLRALVRSYGKTDAATLHFLRSFRAVMHGFVELTANGFMVRGPASRDETYSIIVEHLLNTLKGLPDA